jgi:hypothetical protein
MPNIYARQVILFNIFYGLIKHLIMTSNLTKLTTFLLLLGMTLVNNGCKNDTDTNGNDTSVKKVSDYPNEVVYEWNELFLKIERYAAGYRPGPAPTALGIYGFCGLRGDCTRIFRIQIHSESLP